MKVPTLIVRLVGLGLLVYCAIGLFQIHQAHSMAGSVDFGGPQESIISTIRAIDVAGLIVGLIACLFAGPLAKLLKFDSE